MYVVPHPQSSMQAALVLHAFTMYRLLSSEVAVDFHCLTVEIVRRCRDRLLQVRKPSTQTLRRKTLKTKPLFIGLKQALLASLL